VATKKYAELTAEEKETFDAAMDLHASKLLHVPEPPAPDGYAHWLHQPVGPRGQRSITLGQARKIMDTHAAKVKEEDQARSDELLAMKAARDAAEEAEAN